MAQASFALMTNVGRAKEAVAIANGTAITITHIAIGDGTTVPSGGETALYNEVARKTISGHGTVAGATNVAYFDIYLAAAEGPYTIREAGLYDVDGDLIAIASYNPPINKPVPSSGQTVEGTIRLEVAFSNIANVIIVVDPSMSVALQRLTVLPWIPVLGITTTTPPANPTPGDTYVIPPGATGAWAGQAQKVAEYTLAGWAIIAPKDGHAIGLSGGSVFIRINGTYVQMNSSLTYRGLTRYASVAESYAALISDKAVTPDGLANYTRRQTQDLTLYVRADGNDANDGGANTTARAMKTIQAAIDRANGLYSGSGFLVSIVVGAGTFAAASAAYSGSMRFRIVGVGNSLSGTIIDGAGGVGCITSVRSNIIVDSVRLQNADSLLRAIGGELRFSNVAFGAATANHIYSIEGGTIVATGNYSILASAAYHAVAGQNSYVYLSAVTITAPGGNYANAFYYCNGGSISAAGTTYSFTATGARYQVNIGGILWTNNALASVPGNAAGVIGSGGEAY